MREFAVGEDGFLLEAAEPLADEEWNGLAVQDGLIPDGGALRLFQTRCSNIVIGFSGDACVIAPTGAGKSLLWILPLLVHKEGVSLVITPYTSLGLEGEAK